MILQGILYRLKIKVVGYQIEILEGRIFARLFTFPVLGTCFAKKWYIWSGAQYWVEVKSFTGSRRVGKLLSESAVERVVDQFASIDFYYFFTTPVLEQNSLGSGGSYS